MNSNLHQPSSSSDNMSEIAAQSPSSRRTTELRHLNRGSFSRTLNPSYQNELERCICAFPLGSDEFTVHHTSPFMNNSVRTARYTFYDFIPKQLFVQFKKLANVYFLIVSILQLIPNVSSTGQFTTIIPLSIFVSLAILREGFDDRRRQRQDALENSSKTCILKHNREGGDSWELVEWKSLRPGDRVLIRNNESVPADILILATSEDEGACYVETMNLDGETNLKTKQAVPLAVANVKNVADLSCSKFVIKAQLPNNNLYAFEGSIGVDDNEPCPVSLDHLLLRGSTLKKTRWIMGVVVYTGEDTKIRRNANNKNQAKNSVMDTYITNRIVVLVFIFILLLSLTSFIIFTAWKQPGSIWYLGGSSRENFSSIQFFTFFILYNAIIPVSLYVTLEMVKLAQALLIESDILIYDEETDTAAESRTSSLNEDLGQVSYLFTDKTGTLTENKMILRYVSAGGRLVCVQEDEEGNSDNLSLHSQSRPDFIESCASTLASNQSDMATEFMRALVLCHSVIASYPDEERHPRLSDEDLVPIPSPITSPTIPNNDVIENIDYQATSPDDVALMVGCRACKFPFLRRVKHDVSFGDPLGKLHVMQQEATLEFSSSRKRMSVIYSKGDGNYVLYCKGADSIILPRTVKSESDGVILDQVNAMAKIGLRTLIVAKRDLGREEFEDFKNRYRDASLSVEDRVAKVEAVCETVEVNLRVIGATGIEDRLQEGVPYTIDLLQRAGIKIWVLTGDKRETVINIGRASKIIKDKDVIVQFGKDLETSMDLEWSILSEPTISSTSSNDRRILVVDGEELKVIENSPKLVDKFILFASRMSTVICCRVSPVQKALMVRYARKRLQLLLDAAYDLNPLQPFGSHWPVSLYEYNRLLPWYKRNFIYKMYQKMNRRIIVTCAIGDGANDVSMIQEAHVGVGIAGREGLQAARSSDYSIAQFRFLQSLILIHGHWSYCRNSRFLLGSFYKNIVFYLTQFMFQFLCNFSGTSLYEQWTLALFNVAWASLTVISGGVFDQRNSKRRMINNPSLYMVGPSFQLYNLSEFLKVALLTVYQSAVCVGFIVTSVSKFNQEYGMFGMGLMIYSSMIIVINVKLSLLNVYHYAWPILFFPIFTICAWFIFFQPVYSVIYGPTKLGAEVLGLYFALFANPLTYLNILFVVVVALLPEFVIAWIHHKPINDEENREIDHLPLHDPHQEMVNLNLMGQGSPTPLLQ